MDFLKRLMVLFSLSFADTSFNVHDTSDLDNFIPEHWDTKIRLDAERKAFWDKFEGEEGSNMPIIRRNDFTKNAGDVVHVDVLSRLKTQGVAGETSLKGKEGKLTSSQFDLKVDWLRNAVGFNKRGTKRAFINAAKIANQALSTWLAKTKDDECFAQLLDLGAQERLATADSATPTTIYPNDATSVATLASDDTMGAAELNKVKFVLGRKHALPIQTIMDGKQMIEFFGIVMDDIAAEYYLKNDATWKQVQQDAGLRGEKNRLFTGAFGQYNSLVVYVHKGLAGEGTYLRPEAQVSAQSLANAEILFGTSGDRVPYQKGFVKGATKYVRVAAADGTETAVTMDAGAITSSVESEAEIEKQYHLVAHTHAQFEAGDLITQENHYASAIGFGAEAAARVWGMYPSAIRDMRDYGFEYGIGVEAVFGHKMIENTDAEAPNHVVLRHYCKNPYYGV